MLKKFIRIAWKILRSLLTIILIPFVLYAVAWSYHRIYATIISAESRWLKDLGAFEESLLTKHVNPDWISTQTHVKVKKRLDSLRQVVVAKKGLIDRDSMRVSMMQISALLQDGHTRIANYLDDTGNFPITVQFYRDGLFVVAADSGHADLLGHKIVAINDYPLEEVLRRLYTICPSPNVSGQKLFSENYLKKPALLYGLGLTKDRASAIFHLEDENGAPIKAELNGFTNSTKQVAFDDGMEGSKSWHRNQSSKAYWYEYDPERALLYLKYNRVASIPNAPMDSFVDGLMKFVDSVHIAKFVIDIRNNGGGDNFFSASLVTEIQKRSKINRKGVLYLITGHQTFSAAICFAGNLSIRTNVTVAGEPFADFNNLPGDGKFFDYHMNRMTWQVSELFWENTYYGDQRTTTSVDIPHETSFDEDLRGENPLLDLILTDGKDENENLWEFPDSLVSRYTGRYRFSPDKTLQLDLDHGKIKISGLIQSDLSYLSDTVVRAENLRFSLKMKNDQLILVMDNGNQRVLDRLRDDEFTALELLQMTEYERARKAYLSLHAKYGDSLEALAANNMSTMANYLYQSTGDNTMQKELLKITLEMHPATMLSLARMSAAKAIDGEQFGALLYKIKAFWYFDWKNIDNYAKAFGFL